MTQKEFTLRPLIIRKHWDLKMVNRGSVRDKIVSLGLNKLTETKTDFQRLIRAHWNTKKSNKKLMEITGSQTGTQT